MVQLYFWGDGANAFNSCDRQQFLNQLYEKFPELSLFIEQWYVSEAPLWFAKDDGSIQTILSSDGAQQGDPHGSFLFCLGAALILERIAQALPHCFIGAIIDDITVAAPAHLIPFVIEIVSQHFGDYGIRLALRNCLIDSPPQTSHLLPAETPQIIPQTYKGFNMYNFIPEDSIQLPQPYLAPLLLLPSIFLKYLHAWFQP
jgi:hypothetical protein